MNESTSSSPSRNELADRLDAFEFEGLDLHPRVSTELQGLMGLAAEALRSEKAQQPVWVSPTDRQPDIDGRLWAVLTARRENGELTGYVPEFEYYHFTDGWATDDTILFWLDSPLHPLPSIRPHRQGKAHD